MQTTPAGLLLAVPDPVSLDLPALAAAAGYPGTRVIPAVSWLMCLLALKLTRTRRVSHVDDLLTDPAAALLAEMAVLPKKSALTDYSYRLSHDRQQRFLAALPHLDFGSKASKRPIFRQVISVILKAHQVVHTMITESLFTLEEFRLIGSLANVKLLPDYRIDVIDHTQEVGDDPHGSKVSNLL